MGYKIDVDSGKKAFFLSAWGFVPPEEGEKCFKEFSSKISQIDPSQYYLVLDGSKLDASEEAGTVILEAMLKAYTTFPFKKRFLAKCVSPIAQSQIKRLLRGGYNQYFVEVENVDAALKLI